MSKRKSTLETTAEALHKARRELYEAESALEVEQALFNSKNKRKLERLEAAKLAVQLNDETLRKAMIQEYKKSGQTALAAGLDIKMRKVVQHTESDENDIRDWCVSHAPFLLSINWSWVETVAQALPGSIPGVWVEEKPTPFIAKDLSKTIGSNN